MRVLLISQRFPYAPNRGDRLRVYHMLREVAGHAQVDVAALVHDDEEAAHTADLVDLADEIIAERVPRRRNLMQAAATLVGSTPLTHVLLNSPGMESKLAALVARQRPDVIFAFCSSMARFALRPPLASVPCVIDMIDADSAKWTELSKVTRPPMGWIYKREARLLGRFEVTAMRHAFMTLVVNEKERAALDALAPGSRVQVLQNGVDLASFKPTAGPQSSASVVFCGVMNYEPNVRGAVWLSRNVWPLVRARRPDARLVLVGMSPSAEVRALNSQGSGITVTGAVEDVRTYLWAAAVAAAPLQIARGVQNKVLEAIAAGLPCVVTSAVADGLPTEVMAACSVARDAEQFAGSICDALRRSPDERRAMAASADLTPLQWSARLQPLVPLLEAAARSRAK